MAYLRMNLKAHMPCKASPTEHLNKPTQSKVQLLQRVVSRFNSPYTQTALANVPIASLL